MEKLTELTKGYRLAEHKLLESENNLIKTRKELSETKELMNNHIAKYEAEKNDLKYEISMRDNEIKILNNENNRVHHESTIVLGEKELNSARLSEENKRMSDELHYVIKRIREESGALDKSGNKNKLNTKTLPSYTDVNKMNNLMESARSRSNLK